MVINRYARPEGSVMEEKFITVNNDILGAYKKGASIFYPKHLSNSKCRVKGRGQSLLRHKNPTKRFRLFLSYLLWYKQAVLYP